jgi:hypothetical protein
MKTALLRKAIGLIGFAIIGLTLAVTSGLAQNLPIAGFKFVQQNVSDAGSGTLIKVEYVGECPGETNPAARARFFSTTTRPAPDLRAIVRNVTFGFSGETQPFTDREYHSGDVSEGFNIQFGEQHSGRFLAVQPGENQFEYQIKRGQQIIENGEFTTSFDQKTVRRSRNTVSVRRESKYCYRYKDDRCVEKRTRVYYDQVCQG